MRIIETKSFDDLKKHPEYKRLIAFIRYGAVFIYPTDTIYGIGCNALKDKSVQKIRLIKMRDSKPFSVIAPSKKWIFANCIVKSAHKKFLDKLPGRYTLIFRLKKKNAVSRYVNITGINPKNNVQTLGVRIPAHFISKITAELNVPIVTTSVNLTGKKNIASLNELNHLENKRIVDGVDFIIYAGKKDGKPSTIVDLTSEEAVIIKRKR